MGTATERTREMMAIKAQDYIEMITERRENMRMTRESMMDTTTDDVSIVRTV